MIRAAATVLAAIVLVAAAAGTSTARSPVALTASPARVALQGSGRATIRVTNSGAKPVVVDVQRAGFALDLRGRPKIVAPDGARAAGPWLAFRPRRLTLDPGAASSVTVVARVPGGTEPGDYDALVLLTTRPRRDLGLAVRMRIGVVVVVRAPGAIVRKLEPLALGVRKAGAARTLELLVANRGNVTETVGRNRVLATLSRRGTVYARLRPLPRSLRPRTRGVVELRYRGRLEGWVTARVTVWSGRGAVRRTFRVRL